MTCRNRTDRQAAFTPESRPCAELPGIRELAHDRLRLGQQEFAAGVKRTDRPSRSNNGVPISDSSFRICCESEGWATPFCSDARVKPPMRATAQK